MHDHIFALSNIIQVTLNGVLTRAAALSLATPIPSVETSPLAKCM
jgi:hypothetical protein